MSRSRTVWRDASAFRRVTLVVLTACLVAVLASQRGAAAAEGAPGVLQHLAGCFEVSYRFVEDGVHDQDIRGELFEEITIEEHDGVYAFQHYGIFKGRRIKHWREEPAARPTRHWRHVRPLERPHAPFPGPARPDPRGGAEAAAQSTGAGRTPAMARGPMSAGGSPRTSACIGVLGKGSIHETHIGAARSHDFSGVALGRVGGRGEVHL